MPEEWKLHPGGPAQESRRDGDPLDDFVAQADAERRAGRSAEAEELLRAGLGERPSCEKGVLLLALVLLDQHRGDEARETLETWADAGAASLARGDSGIDQVFGGDLTEGEFEHAFEVAETNPDEVFDADAIAQRAMQETELELEAQFTSAESNFATRTVADLLAQQGDERRASRVRALTDPPGGEPADAPARGRSTLRSDRMRKLEEWLENIRGGRQ